jgi:hypothetical protein
MTLHAESTGRSELQAKEYRKRITKIVDTYMLDQSEAAPSASGGEKRQSGGGEGEPLRFVKKPRANPR